MTPPIVQAKCPHCKKSLRVPAEWLDRTMRCKLCRHVIQGKHPLGGNGVPVATPIGAAAGAPFTFDEPDTDAPVRPSRKRGGKKFVLVLAGLAFVALVLIPAAGLAITRFVTGGDGGMFAFLKGPVEATMAALPSDGSATPRKRPVDDVPPKKGGEAKGGEKKIAPPVDPPTKKTPESKEPETKGPAKTGPETKGPTKKGPETKGPTKKGPTKKGPTKKGPSVTPTKGGSNLFPRRALLVSVNNYLMFNTLNYGSPRDRTYPGSSTRVLADQLTRPPLYFPATQVYELSDASSMPHPTQKSAIEGTIADFLDSSREQDRILLLFAGHACEIEKECYLIPIEGRTSKPETLIPLKWVYDRLAKCKARQKVLILDVFRFPPARGFELPGAGEGEHGAMGEAFDLALLTPPAGVQVWSSCVKGQAAIELDRGSAFLQALLHTLQERGGMTGIASPGDSLPVEALVPRVNKRLKELLTPEKLEQVSRLTGKEAAGGAPYNPDEPLSPKIALRPPAAPPGGAAGNAQVNKILEELRLLPPVRETRAGELALLKAENLPTFPADKLSSYQAEDYTSIGALRDQYTKEPEKFAEKYPLRAAVFDAVKALQDGSKVRIRETLNGPIDPKRKSAFLKEQQEPGMMIFELEQALGQMKTVAGEREKEPSKRWQANFDYTMARLESRLVYLFEYSYILGQIRSDSLPALESGQSGWRIGSRTKVQVPEPKAKTMARKEIPRLWRRIREQYPDTPWAILAERESLIALGLEWRAKSD